jgi:Transposase
MIGALKQVEAGRAVEDVAREVGVSKHTLYAWKAKYGGMDVSQAHEANWYLRKRSTAPLGVGENVHSLLKKFDTVHSGHSLVRQQKGYAVCLRIFNAFSGESLPITR